MNTRRKNTNPDPTDVGLFRRAKQGHRPPPGLAALAFNPGQDPHKKLASFLSDQLPALARYRTARAAVVAEPGCPVARRELDKAGAELEKDPVAAAVQNALEAAEIAALESNRAGAVWAGWKLAEALHLWAVGEELLRKKNLLSGKALAARPRPKRSEKNLLRRVVCEVAWPAYLAEAGPDATKSDFVEWLKYYEADEWKVEYVDRNGEEDFFSFEGFKARPDTVRRWLNRPA